jgi:peptidoglycan/xylan/chitin deacetylase (PgdA/CDA1 family)
MIGRFRQLVLCYHAVSDGWTHPLSVPPALFERQIRTLLLRRFQPASVDDVLRGTGRTFHVTFDDAYRSISAALPILDRLNVPATIFACADFADEGGPLTVPELSKEAAATPHELATMTWDDLRGLAKRGIEIGSHTLTHAHLTRLGEAELLRELRDSRLRFEDEIGVPCRLLSYPYGEHDTRVRQAARRAGYRAAFGLFRDSPRQTDLYAFPRVDIYRRDNAIVTTAKTSRSYGPALALLRLVRAR